MNELTREEFTELLVQELKNQGVSYIPKSERGQFVSLVHPGASTWTPEKTVNALLLSQPRAPEESLLNLVAFLRDESNYPYFFPLDVPFFRGVGALVSSDQPGSARLAGYVYVELLLTHPELFSPELLKQVATLLPRFTLVESELELLFRLVQTLETTPECWRAYANLLSDHIHSSAHVLKWEQCQPRRQNIPELQPNFVTCFSMVCKRVGNTPTVIGVVDRLKPSLSELLHQSSSNWEACFALCEISPAMETVRFACNAWNQESGEMNFLQVENFLLAVLPRLSRPQQLFVYEVAGSKAMQSVSYTSMLWPLVFSVYGVFDTIKGKTELQARIAQGVPDIHLLVAYLAKHPGLVQKVSTWEEAQWFTREFQSLAMSRTMEEKEEESRVKRLECKRVLCGLQGIKSIE